MTLYGKLVYKPLDIAAFDGLAQLSSVVAGHRLQQTVNCLLYLWL